ncbi:unnamed protein product [Rotaria sp. Silwood2]|nr:unnamed protein product [Rotaria sp. Silwood2]CAF3248961.1 unnamed protein product [Rotaria sp. Silwood2]CAF4367838.1 unnamed protein product [Rotaria sp. Silwood2]CAF4376443.1 unnamed protein product [Rotaria sp. Silwood2]
MAFDIIWALSFNSVIVKQLQSNQSFKSKLVQTNHQTNDENVRKIINGILWNLNSNREENIVVDNSNTKKFDIMISYSHKDKQICKQLYDELIQVGYRIWIDFNQMHGNVMDAMVEAIEQSRTIMICMSEQYRRSNYCRAEAQYAFQKQLNIVPILLQKHYKPDGWLAFLIGSLLYIDFTKNEYSKALELLMNELKMADTRNEISTKSVQSKLHSVELLAITSCLTQPPSQSITFPENVQHWTETHVHRWLSENDLPQMARILLDMDGLNLIYFSEYMIKSEPQHILSLLQQDSLRRINENVSLIEISRFRNIVQGEINPLVKNVRQFIGFPFAQPPIGTLRFKTPIRIRRFKQHVPPITAVNPSSTHIYNTTARAHQDGFPRFTCTQSSFSNSSVIYAQEDCLYLDIFLPLHINHRSLLPVVIYIYGGGFQTTDPHNPSRIISLYQNIIYVAIRYRVNVFGFMASTSLSASRLGPIQSSGLQGFEDQQMAMKWVRDNIRYFGGDPNRVTLQGHSAGGVSVCLHLIAPASQGLFHRAIIESGGCDIGQVSLQQMEVIGDDITSHFYYLNFFSLNAIHPPIDGLIIPDSITNLFQQKKFSKKVPLLTGTTSAEFGLFIAGGFEPGWQIRNLSQTVLSQWVQIYSKGQSAYLNTTYNPYIAPYLPSILVNYYGLADALSTAIFQCSVRRTAAYLTNNECGSVYLYSFDYVPLSSPCLDLSQSVHAQELPFIFNTANSSALTQIIFPVNTFSENEQILASAMSLLWIRFAVHGNPNTPLDAEETNPLITQLNQFGAWPKYSTNTVAGLSSYLIFANQVSRNSSTTIRLLTSGYHSPICAAWDQIVPNPTIVKRCAAGFSGPNCSSLKKT